MKRVKSRGGFLRMCFTQDIAPTLSKDRLNLITICRVNQLEQLLLDLVVKHFPLQLREI
jgi:hypothetical protein